MSWRSPSALEAIGQRLPVSGCSRPGEYFEDWSGDDDTRSRSGFFELALRTGKAFPAPGDGRRRAVCQRRSPCTVDGRLFVISRGAVFGGGAALPVERTQSAGHPYLSRRYRLRRAGAASRPVDFRCSEHATARRTRSLRFFDGRTASQ